MSIMAFLVCMVSVILFVCNYYRGTTKASKMLSRLFKFQDKDLNFIDRSRTLYVVLAVVTLLAGIVVIFLDYINMARRRSRRKNASRLSSAGTFFVSLRKGFAFNVWICSDWQVMCIVFAIMVLWIYVYVKVDQINFIYKIYEVECRSEKTREKMGRVTGSNCLYFEMIGKCLCLMCFLVFLK